MVPAGDGTPTISFTNGSTAHEKRIPPQPLAPGAANELSTRRPPLNVTTVPDGFSVSVPGKPLIDLFGGGGEVVAVVKLRLIGWLLEPM